MSGEAGEAGAAAPVGVFDSGVGGLTVAAAIRRHLGSENVFYLGDTARVPYGGKSKTTVQRYSVEIGGLLLAEGAKAIVVACNTASALAVDRLRELFRAPVLGVVEPGARAAVEASRSGKIAVIGTKATIASGAYERAIRAMDPAMEVTGISCPLLVPLIEEGILDEDPILEAVLARYLSPLRNTGIDTLVLGCTHYPLAGKAIAKAVGDSVTLVDSAENCAFALRDLLAERGLAKEETAVGGGLRVALTDAAESFLHTAAHALGLPLESVELRSVQGIQS